MINPTPTTSLHTPTTCTHVVFYTLLCTLFASYMYMYSSSTQCGHVPVPYAPCAVQEVSQQRTELRRRLQQALSTNNELTRECKSLQHTRGACIPVVYMYIVCVYTYMYMYLSHIHVHIYA